MVNPSAADAKVRPLTDDGVIAPRPIVRAGVGEAIDQVAVTPLLAAAVETEVTVPFPLATIFPFNLLIAPTIESAEEIVPVVDEYPVRSFPTTAASVKDADGSALVARVP